MQKLSSKPNAARVALLLSAPLLAATGCGGYGEVSPTTYQYAKALYSVTNRQQTAQLDTVSAQIEQARESGELPDREAGWLQAIVDDARAGDWKTANSAAREMMQEQVSHQRRPPAPSTQ